MFEATISPIDDATVLALFGTRDQHVRLIGRSFGVRISHRDGAVRVVGPQDGVLKATAVLESLRDRYTVSGAVTPQDVAEHLSLEAPPRECRAAAADEPTLHEAPADLMTSGRQVRPQTQGQARYIAAIREHDVTLGVGPAGTGKTYLAVAMAVEAFKHQKVRKIVLVRPAVEAGESLGYLPGDLQAKLNPYLRPLMDALREMMDYEQIKRYSELDLIEVIPLAYMRGRTLNDCFIILDEAQNTTVAQMKMFLTRMGFGSKMVVSGDATQVDLPESRRSGLDDAVRRLESIPGVAVVRLDRRDIVRHRLVQRIVEAYDDVPERGKRRDRDQLVSGHVPR